MPHLRSRQKGDRKRQDGFTPDSGPNAVGKKKPGGTKKNESRGHKNAYASFSSADRKQAEIAANGGSLLGTMPALKERREREEAGRGYGRSRTRFW